MKTAITLVAVLGAAALAGCGGGGDAQAAACQKLNRDAASLARRIAGAQANQATVTEVEQKFRLRAELANKRHLNCP